MKTKLLLVTVILFSFFCSFSVQQANAQLKIGFVELDVIKTQLPEYKIMIDSLTKIRQLYADTIQMLQGYMQAVYDTATQKQDFYTKKVQSGEIKDPEQIKSIEAELNDYEKRINDMKYKIDAYTQKALQLLRQKQAEMEKPIKAKIKKAVEDIAKELKYNFIFEKRIGGDDYDIDVVIYGDKEADLTFKVLDKLK